MLRHSNLFDKNGRPRLTAENQSMLLRVDAGSAPVSFKDCVERVGLRVDAEVLPMLRVFCENRGVAVPEKPSPAVLLCVRLRVCYALENQWSVQSWASLETPAQMMSKLDKRLEALLQSKKECSLVNDKLKLHRELESQLTAAQRAVAEYVARTDEIAGRMRQAHLRGFLKQCFEVIMSSQNNHSKQLYYLLSKHEQGVVKTMPRNDLQVFQQLEHFQSLFVDLRALRSKQVDLSNKLEVSSATIHDLLSPAEATVVRVEEEVRMPVLTVEALALDVPDSWDD